MIADMSSFLESTEFLSTLAGAFIGTAFTFLLSIAREVKLERDKRHSEIIKAQHTLGLQRNDLQNILDQFLNPKRGLPSRGAALPKIGYPFTTLRVNADGLSFLSANPTHAGTYSDTILAEASFRNCIICAENLNAAKDALAAVSELVGIDAKNPRNMVYSIPTKYADRTHHLEVHATNFYQTVDGACVQLEVAIKKLAETGQQVLPEKNFLRYVSANMPGKQVAPPII